VMVSLGPHLEGNCLPHPDLSDSETMAFGVYKRIAAKLPSADPKMLMELRSHVQEFLEKNFRPLSPDEDLTFETWLSEKDYPAWRKAELNEVHESMVQGSIPKSYRKVKCFMKAETYVEFKHGRGIFSRSDQFKCLYGPLCAAIEKQMYEYPAFIKHIPVPDRPKYISEVLATDCDDTRATDYTSYESSFSKELMDVLDFELFRFFFKNFDEKFLERYFEVKGGENTCVFKWFTLLIQARRMSGEMDTSLCNGFANFIVTHFLCKKVLGCEPRMVVEGDDGLTKTDKGKFPTPEDYAKLGFNIKLVTHEEISTASFCGIIFHPDDRVNVTDPRTLLASFGWAGRQYCKAGNKTAMKLLRCKALSYLYQYPGCPIVQELALYGLRVTRSFDVRSFIENERSFGWWQRAKFREALGVRHDVIREVPMNTRILVDRLYGIPVETQVKLEEQLRSMDRVEPIKSDLLFNLPRDWSNYWNQFVAPKGQPPLVRPRRGLTSYKAVQFAIRGSRYKK